MAKTAKRKDRNGRVLPDGVSHRADGRYIYRYNLYGKPHYIYDNDLNSLKKKIAQHKLDVASGRNCDLADMTLQEWHPQYVKIFKEGKVKDATLLNWKNYYEWYMEPYDIVRIPMRDLKRSQFVAHFKFLAEKKGLAEGTLRAIASMMYNCLQQVVYDSGLFVNPASEIMKDVSAKAKEETEALSDEQVEMLLDFLKIEHSYQSIYLPIIGVLLGTGLRFGECDGLTWNDIDFKKKVLYVNKTLHYRCKNSKKHEFFITAPKTVNSYRQIPLTNDLVKLFQMQKQYQMDMGIGDDIEISGYKGFVFTTKLGNPFTHEGFVAILERIVKRANKWETQRAEEEQREPVLLPKLKPHMFRHTFCTKLVLKEVPYETTKTLMGHSSIKTTIDVYTHIKKEHMKKVRMDIEGVVKIF